MRCRKQDNGEYCGIFMLMRMEYISRGMAPERMSGSMNFYRRRIAADFLAETLL